ncbi:hypothetical protein DH2020_026043 [Rehmannia glutinosa]|uniref:PPM-type phosphatase domain-containing protein n=1 Tax=Rehmannia glutinosa TaxID=99300 RepID=A0ABR0W221_REHGL
MGNGIRKLSVCFAGDAGEISRRRNDVAPYYSEPLDEGLGHSYCYIPHEFTHKPQSFENSSAAPKTTPFRTISGAAISANVSTPLSTDPFAYMSSTSLDKASAFESSNYFSSIPLQPIPRNYSVKSGPILRNSVPGSGPIEPGFLSGPIERSFISGPLDNNQFDSSPRYNNNNTPTPKKRALVKNLKKVMSKSFWSFSKELNRKNEKVMVSESNSGNSSTITSHNLSSELSLVDENDYVANESFMSQNLQWAQGKAGEDRVHIVISEEHGWIFVGIYDGFNGPDATDFLLNNLYSNVYKELKWLLCCDNGENTGFGKHSEVLKGLSEALRKTEESYLEISDMVLIENPELALMGSCVLVMVMKGDDVYLMNVGDSRAVLAKNDSQIGKMKKDCCDELVYGYEYDDDVCNLSSCQLTMDHSTSVKEDRLRFLILSSDGLYQYFTNEEAVSEVEIFMSTFPEGDPAQHLVKEVLFRAAKEAGMDFHQLLDIPQGERRRYHDDVSVIIISFDGSTWRSSV